MHGTMKEGGVDASNAPAVGCHPQLCVRAWTRSPHHHCCGSAELRPAPSGNAAAVVLLLRQAQPNGCPMSRMHRSTLLYHCRRRHHHRKTSGRHEESAQHPDVRCTLPGRG